MQMRVIFPAIFLLRWRDSIGVSSNQIVTVGSDEKRHSHCARKQNKELSPPWSKKGRQALLTESEVEMRAFGHPTLLLRLPRARNTGKRCSYSENVLSFRLFVRAFYT